MAASSFTPWPGAAYRVSFFGSREPWQLREWMSASIVTLEVSVAAGTNLYTSDFNAGFVGGMNWTPYAFTFIAISNTSTLTFRQTTGPYEYDGACLDEVAFVQLRASVGKLGDLRVSVTTWRERVTCNPFCNPFFDEFLRKTQM